jgi:hypothetical protein
MLVAGCTDEGSGSDLVTYTDPANLTLLDVPANWHIYEIEEINELERVPFVENVSGLEFPVESVVGFDGGPVDDVDNLAGQVVGADFPIGAATVRSVGERERDFVSRFALTQSVLPYFSLPNAQELTKEDFSFGNGYEGVRVLVAYADATGQNIGVAYMISVTDDNDERIFSVVAGCSRECFMDRQQDIESVVDSWLVNTRD